MVSQINIKRGEFFFYRLLISFLVSMVLKMNMRARMIKTNTANQTSNTGELTRMKIASANINIIASAVTIVKKNSLSISTRYAKNFYFN